MGPAVQHIDVDLLRTFVAIADTKSFSGAAERIARTPSAVSMQVKRLEETVGRRLFERDSRNVALTPFAEGIVPEARALLETNASLLARMRAPELTGRIAIGIPDDYASVHMPCILKRFARSHPSVQVDVRCDDSSELVARLRDGDLDASLVTRTDVGERSGLLSDDVHEEQIVWLGAVNGTACYQRPLPVAASHAHCCWRIEAIDALSRARVPHRIAYTSTLSAGQLAAIAADLAVCPLPRCIATGKVAEVPADAGLPALPPSTIAWVRRDDSNALVRALGEHVRGLFAAEATTVGRAA